MGEASNLPIVKIRNAHKTNIVVSKRYKWWIKQTLSLIHEKEKKYLFIYTFMSILYLYK